MYIPKYSLLSFKIFFDLKEIIFESFNISENNIITVKLAEVLGYTPPSFFLATVKHEQVSFGEVFLIC
jgi:hypothetical protein